MSKRRFSRLRKSSVNQPAVVFEEIRNKEIIPYDENLLERARTQWLFGDWSKLALLERDTLQHHPDRSKLALLAAAGRLQTDDAENAKLFLELAKDWGCSKRLMCQILVAGVHNSLGRAQALMPCRGIANQHFKKSLEIGMPGSDSKLLSHARMWQQLNEEPQKKAFIQDKGNNLKLYYLYINHVGYVSDKWDLYLKLYEKIFLDYRSKKVSLLEIGIQNGGSLEIWDKFFANAEVIVGCDIDQKCGELKYASKKIKLAIGDVCDEETQELIFALSPNFDIVIDDGSHKSGDVVRTFCALFPRLKQGGVYIVEDLHCSYWRGWDGGLEESMSSISFFKSLVDFVNYEHWELKIPRGQWLQNKGFLPMEECALAEIHSVSFYNSMCVVEKRRDIDNILGVRHVVGFNEKVQKVKSGNGNFSKVPS